MTEYISNKALLLLVVCLLLTGVALFRLITERSDEKIAINKTALFWTLCADFALSIIFLTAAFYKPHAGEPFMLNLGGAFSIAFVVVLMIATPFYFLYRRFLC